MHDCFCASLPIDAATFRAWHRRLSEKEAKVTRELCILIWCEGVKEQLIELPDLARLAHVRRRDVSSILRALFEKGVLYRLDFYDDDRAAIVALTLRWRMEETP